MREAKYSRHIPQNVPFLKRNGPSWSFWAVQEKSRFAFCRRLLRGWLGGCGVALAFIGGWVLVSVLCEFLDVLGVAPTVLGLWCFICIWEQKSSSTSCKGLEEAPLPSPRMSNKESVKRLSRLPEAAGYLAAGKENHAGKFASQGRERRTKQKLCCNTTKKGEGPPRHLHKF